MLRILPPTNPYLRFVRTSSFGLVTDQGRLTLCCTCRDVFHSATRSSLPTQKCIFRGNLRNAKKLFQQIEDRLAVPKENRAEFCRTDKTDWHAVVPHWWFEDPMRRSLFTILLRGSRERDSIRKISDFSYLKGTKTAFRLFLDGYTESDIGNSHAGWRDVLKKKPYSLYPKDAAQKTSRSLMKKVKHLADLMTMSSGKALRYHIAQALGSSDEKTGNQKRKKRCVRGRNK